MSTFTSNGESSRTGAAPGVSDSLRKIEVIIGDDLAPVQDVDAYRRLTKAFQTLHAQMRIHHTIGLDATESVADRYNAPELSSEEQRLNAEHKPMIGLLDRLIREGESMADRPAEDQLVFTYRVHEMIGIIRRHDAEDRRLLYLAAWRDTGGES
jgi:hypothetical protein